MFISALLLQPLHFWFQSFNQMLNLLRGFLPVRQKSITEFFHHTKSNHAMLICFSITSLTIQHHQFCRVAPRMRYIWSWAKGYQTTSKWVAGPHGHMGFIVIIQRQHSVTIQHHISIVSAAIARPACSYLQLVSLWFQRQRLTHRGTLYSGMIRNRRISLYCCFVSRRWRMTQTVSHPL